jgi:hypothetical protein
MDKFSSASFFFGVLLTIAASIVMDDEVDRLNVLAVMEAIQKCPNEDYKRIKVSGVGVLEGDHRETKILCSDGSVITQKHKYVSSGR